MTLGGVVEENIFYKKITSTTYGEAVPLMQPEAMMFPARFWKYAQEQHVITGAIPAPLLSKRIKSFGF